METFFESELGTAASSCPCGCRGEALHHEAFMAGLQGEVRRLGRPAARRSAPPRSPKARPVRPRPISGYRPTRPRPAVSIAGRYREEPPPPPENGGGPPSERTRWAQDCLNHALGMRLAVTGVMGPDTRSALRSFQRRQGLRPTGILGPDTVEALRGACGLQEGTGTQEEISAAIQKMPVSKRPKFEYVGQLSNIPRTLTENGPGLYMIMFKPRGGRTEKAYVGKAKHLRGRLLEHLWCLTHLGLRADGYRVFVARMPGARDARLRAAEKAVNSVLIPRRLVTNVNPELEWERERQE